MHVSYYIVTCDLSVSTILFAHFLINGKIFGKSITDHQKSVVIFLQIFPKNVLFVRKIRRDIIANEKWVSCQSNRHNFGILMKV